MILSLIEEASSELLHVCGTQGINW